MNEEKVILAELKRRLIKQGKAYYEENQYWPSYIDEMLRLIAEIESELILGVESIEVEEV